MTIGNENIQKILTISQWRRFKIMAICCDEAGLEKEYSKCFTVLRRKRSKVLTILRWKCPKFWPFVMKEIQNSYYFAMKKVQNYHYFAMWGPNHDHFAMRKVKILTFNFFMALLGSVRTFGFLQKKGPKFWPFRDEKGNRWIRFQEIAIDNYALFCLIRK